MATKTEAELIQDLADINAHQVKTAGEIAALKEGSAAQAANIATLEQVIADLQAAGNTPSEALVAAVQAVKDQAVINDGLLEDLGTPPAP